MRVAIISDSHYSVDKVRRVLTSLEEQGIETLIHAGDFIGQGIEDIVQDFPGIRFYIARGNCDSYGRVLDELNAMAHVDVSDVLRFELDGIRFLVAHIPGAALNALNSEPADVVIHGHTHQPRKETHQDAMLLNPGSLMEGDGYMVFHTETREVDRKFNV